MRVDPGTGVVDGARFVRSPNCDERPPGVPIDLLVIHAISMPPGEFAGPDVEHLFCNRLDAGCHPYYAPIAGLTVSAHLFIRRDGELIQFVPLHARAWHAGVSAFDGRTRVNDFSIGIELEGSDYAPFEEAQYRTLAAVTRAVQAAYPGIAAGRIVGHCDIAPERKTDPGPYFNWARYRAALRDPALVGAASSP